MDISVIVPIYGVEKYIEKCLRSLFEQTKTKGVEFLLVDDCTKDNSIVIAKKIICEYPDLEVKIVNHNENYGLAYARATGINEAKGKYIQHIDSDDWVEPTMLEELFRKAESTNADIVACDYYREDGNNLLKYIKNVHPKDNIECLKALLSTKIEHSLCFKFIKKELYSHNDVNYYIKGVDVWEDLIASVKLFYFAQKVEYLPTAFYHYMNVNAESITGEVCYPQKKLNNIIDALKDVETFVNSSDYKTRLCKNLNDRKLYTKFTLLKRTSGVNQKVYAPIYPEINKYIFKQEGMPFHNKVALYFASTGCINIFNFIMWSVRLYKRTKI